MSTDKETQLPERPLEERMKGAENRLAYLQGQIDAVDARFDRARKLIMLATLCLWCILLGMYIRSRD